MKIKNTRAINEKLMSCVEMREYDRFLSAAIILPVSTENMRFPDVDKLKELAGEFLKRAGADGVSYTEDEALMAAMVLVLVRKYGGKAAGENKEFLYEALSRNGRVFREEFTKDPFLERIWIGGESAGRYTFSNRSYQPYELFFYDSPAGIGRGIKVPRLGVFDREYNYPYLTRDGEGIRALTPYRICTLKKPLEKAAGRVLVLGCGMGYYAYMAHRKAEVEKVTVVETDSELAGLFRRHILPQFEQPEKVEVLEADPFSFVSSLEDGRYDHCFADLWMNNMDPEPYLKLKTLSRRFRKTVFTCWIEESITDMLMNMVFVVILEAFNENIGLASPRPEGVSEEGMRVLSLLRERLAGEEISRPDHIDWYMNPENILKLLT